MAVLIVERMNPAPELVAALGCHRRERPIARLRGDGGGASPDWFCTRASSTTRSTARR
jgi:hypothetical protein